MSATASIAAWTVMEEHQIVLPSRVQFRYFDIPEAMNHDLGPEHEEFIEERVLSSGIDATVATIRSSVG